MRRLLLARTIKATLMFFVGADGGIRFVVCVVSFLHKPFLIQVLI